MKMESFYKACLLLLSILIFTLQSFHHATIFVKGDAALIQAICGKTREQEPCVECLNSDPQASDLQGYVYTSINCPLRQAQDAGHTLDNHKAGETDPTLKAAYDGCVADLETIGQDFVEAINGWSTKDYKAAEDQATKAFDLFSTRCVNLLGLNVPADVVDALNREKALIEDAQDVIKKIM